MKKSQYRLSKREEELMEMLWHAGRPMTTNEMIQEPWERTWKDSYLKIMIRDLLARGLIHVSGIKPHVTIYARQFVATMTQEEYAAKLVCARVAPQKMPKVIKALCMEITQDEALLANLEGLLSHMLVSSTVDD